MAATQSSKRVIYAALAGNLGIAVVKFAAAGWTGSSAMLSEGVYSLVDTGNQGLMLYGKHLSAKPADTQHPLGYGRELYFWTFIVALLIFCLGAGVSFYEGVTHILDPVVIEDTTVNHVVLAVPFFFEGVTWWVAWKEFAKQRGDQGVIDAVTRSRDPTTFLVLFEDSAALIGIVIALVGTAAAVWLDAPLLDGVASILIGVVLAVTAIFLVRESKGLLLGEPALLSTRKSIIEIAEKHPNVTAVGRLVTVHLAPREIVVALDIEFSDDLRASDVEATAAELEGLIRKRHPDVGALFLNPRVRLPATFSGDEPAAPLAGVAGSAGTSPDTPRCDRSQESDVLDKSLIDALATKHAVSPAAVSVLAEAIDHGGGSLAQFNHPDLGGSGQWMKGGMLMIGDMFNDRLKSRVSALCIDLADALGQAPPVESQYPARRSAEWWPSHFGTPSSVGSQNAMRYAFFPSCHRLLIDDNGTFRLYDTGDIVITGAGQQQSGTQSLRFSTPHGPVDLSALRQLPSQS